jgi:hypothetical protein
MPIFSSLDQFKEHKQYVPLLKRALLTVKADARKKFLYVAKYPFGPKKLPLVLVDFEPGCGAALAKAGARPTAEGSVSLTAQDQLNFEATKGELKRVRLKKYFATLGGGLKPIYVPEGETDEEEDTAVEGTPAEPQPALDNTESTRLQLLNRVKQLQDSSFPPRIEALKKPVLDKAGTLAQANKFAEANLLLDQLEAKALTSSPGVTPKAVKTSSAMGEFRPNWSGAKRAWTQASESVDVQIAKLQKALKQTGDPELQQIAEFGLNGVTGNFKVPLMAALTEVDNARDEVVATPARRAAGIAAAFLKHIESAPTVAVCDSNPLTPVSIRATLSPALRALAQAAALAA